ncbi:MAG: Veg family protein [Clostridia bacterium]|nr:Veg family protein [Clostridia bacterium]
MVSKDSLLKVKQEVETHIGQEIFVRANIGRNKCICRRGVIDSTYSNLFVFKECDTSNKLSYSYADLVTNNLQLSSVNGEVLTNYDFSNPKYTRL